VTTDPGGDPVIETRVKVFVALALGQEASAVR
jgi:hypothetical protein